MPFEPDKTKSDWNRAKDALEVILESVNLEQIEKLAVEMSKPEFKKSIKWTLFKSQFLG